MDQIVCPITQAGLAVDVLLGVDGNMMTNLRAAKQQIPGPVQAKAIIDTATTVTAVVSHVLARLPLQSLGSRQTHTAAGPVNVNAFKASLSIMDWKTKQALVVHTDMIVTELPTTLPDAEVLLGLDVLAQCLLVANGPRQEFLLAL